MTGERGAGGCPSFLLLSHNRGRGILVLVCCGLWRLRTHTYLRALAYTLHTVLRRPVNEKREAVVSIQCRYGFPYSITVLR